MKKYNIEIELLSDLCVSDGGSYNSSIDTDVCHDIYGFPYIPAKRLKGCFRESCLELNDWGKNIPIKEIFGDVGNKRAAFSLSSAYLKDYQKNLEIIKNNKNSLLFHPQNILNKYSYVRYQTSVNYDTGVAKDGSLRSIRVVNKGNVFVCEVEIDEKYVDDFKTIVSTTTNIGVNRTRGLGEVKMILIELSSLKEINDINPIQIDDYADYLSYHIHLEEPIICKGFNSNDLSTMDYFEGNKVLGVIANNVGDFLNFINKDELFVSNAYLEYEGNRMKEIPASYYSYKNNKNSCFDKALFRYDYSKQLSKMKHSYIYIDKDNILHSKSVNITDSYHHSRPDDKSIGHALDEGDNGSSKFFQLSSIDAEQSFGGYITGSNEQIKEVYRVLNNLQCKMGFGRSSEFGKVRFSVDKPIKANETSFVASEFIVKLESPAIIYSDKASYSTDNEDLIKEVNSLLNIEVKPEVYSNLAIIGGFNVTWGRRKPIMKAFDKGTVLIYKLDKEQEIKLKARSYIGERIQEGYGEISIFKPMDNNEFEIHKNSFVLKDSRIDCKQDFAKELADMLFNQYLETNLSFIKQHSSDDYRPVVSNMLLMLKEKDMTIVHLDETITDRYDSSLKNKQDKLIKANEIIKHCKDDIGRLISEFKVDNNLDNYEVSVDDALLNYIRKYLIRMKYEIRRPKEVSNV